MKVRIGMMLLGSLLLASCSGQEAEVPEDGIIRLGVSAGVTSRTPMNSLEEFSKAGDRIGVYGMETSHRTAAEPLGGEWTQSPGMKNVQTTAITQDGAISWDGIYKYPSKSEERQYIKFCLYHPYAPESATAVNGSYVSPAAEGQGPVLHFATDGSTDLMYTDPVVGSRLEQAEEVAFNHALTQLSFELVDEEGLFTFPVSELKLTQVNTTAEMDIETGAVGSWGTPGEIELIESTVTLQKGVRTPLDKVVMVQPELTEYGMEITYTDLQGIKTKMFKITPDNETDGKFAAGKSYLITLRFFGNLPVELKATLKPWVNGGEGSGTIK